MKIGNVFLLSLSPFLVLTQEKETKESQAPAGGIFFVRRWAGKGRLGGDGLLLFVGKMKIGGFWVQIFLRDRERANQYVRPLFFDGTMGAYAIRLYPDGRKDLSLRSIWDYAKQYNLLFDPKNSYAESIIPLF